MSDRLTNIKAFLNKAIFYRPKRAVGLDIGSKFIKVVEIVEDSSGYILERYGVRELPTGVVVDRDIMDRDALIENIWVVINDANITEKNVALIVPSKDVIIKSVSMKKVGRGELQKKVEELAEANIPFNLNEISLDFKILEGKKGTQTILLVAAKNEAIYPLIDTVRDAGLSPAILDVMPFVLQNAFQVSGYISHKEVYGIVNIGFERTSIVFIKDGAYYSDQDIAMGVRTFIEAIQKTLSIPFDKAAAVLQGETYNIKGEDVDNAINSTADKLLKRIERGSLSILKKCKKVILSGGGANIAGIRNIFAGKFEVEIGNPLNGFRHKELDIPSHTLDIAVGLALSKLSKERIGVNLLPLDERPVEKSKAVEILKSAFPIYIVGGTLLILAGLSVVLSQKENRLRKDVDNMRAIQLSLQSKVQAVNELMQKSRDISLKVKVIEELEKDKFIRVQLLDELNRLITPNTWLTSIKEEGFGSGLHIVFRGITTSNLAVSNFMRRLDNSVHFKEVKLSYTRMKEIDGIKTTEFEIKGVFQ